MSAMALEERVQRLEDIEAITSLMARYAMHINKGWNGKVVDVEALRGVFAEDATWESADMQLGDVGIEALLQSVKESTASVEFSMHTFINPVIAVNGDAATGNWLFWAGVKNRGPANVIFMSVDATYVRTIGGWRIKTADLHVGMALHSPA